MIRKSSIIGEGYLPFGGRNQPGAELRKITEACREMSEVRRKSDSYKYKLSLEALRGPKRGFINCLAQRVEIQNAALVKPIDALGEAEDEIRVEKRIPAKVRASIRRQFGHSVEAVRIMHGYVSQEEVKRKVNRLCVSKRDRVEKMADLRNPNLLRSYKELPDSMEYSPPRI